jgi:hypothetical protein
VSETDVSRQAIASSPIAILNSPEFLMVTYSNAGLASTSTNVLSVQVVFFVCGEFQWYQPEPTPYYSLAREIAGGWLERYRPAIACRRMTVGYTYTQSQ